MSREAASGPGPREAARVLASSCASAATTACLRRRRESQRQWPHPCPLPMYGERRCLLPDVVAPSLDLFGKVLRARGGFPRRVDVRAAEMPVHRRLAEEWAAQVELLDDAQRAQVEELGDGGGDRRLGNTSRAEGIDPNRDRLDDTDRVRDLDLTFAREACCHDVLGDVPGAVCAGPIDLRRVLAREASAAVARIPAVGVDHDLA